MREKRVRINKGLLFRVQEQVKKYLPDANNCDAVEFALMQWVSKEEKRDAKKQAKTGV